MSAGRENCRCTRAKAALPALVAALVLALTVSVAASSETDSAQSVLERRVEAALLYRFINYVQWPESAFPSPNAPFTIAIAGADALASELSDYAVGRIVLERPLAVRQIRSGESAGDAHIVFIARERAGHLGAILRSVPQNTLVVTEWPGALQHGAVINFLLVDGRLRFEVSLEAAQKRGLRLSSRLLSVAYHVQ